MPSLYRLHSSGEPNSQSPAGTRRVLLHAVAKQNGGCGAGYTLANEFICAALARFIGLSAPPTAFVAGPDGTTLVASLDFNLRDHPLIPVDVAGCLHHLPVLSAGLLLFDFWIANTDRHNGNFHVNWHADPPQLSLFDHGHALLGHIPGGGIARLARLRDELGTVSCLLSRITEDTHFPHWLDRIRATPDFFIEDTCRDAAPYGLTPEECAAAIHFLKERRDHLSELVQRHRAAFGPQMVWSALPAG